MYRFFGEWMSRSPPFGIIRLLYTYVCTPPTLVNPQPRIMAVYIHHRLCSVSFYLSSLASEGSPLEETASDCHTGLSFDKAFFLFVMKLSHRLSEKEKQDDKTACISMSKAPRAGTIWESTEICLFSAPKSMLYTP